MNKLEFLEISKNFTIEKRSKEINKFLVSMADCPYCAEINADNFSIKYFVNTSCDEDTLDEYTYLLNGSEEIIEIDFDAISDLEKYCKLILEDYSW